MKTLELSIIFIYFLVVAGIGFYAKRLASRSTSDYWAAGHNVGPWVNAFAYQAAISSAAALMGFVGLGYKMGFPLVLAIGAGSTLALFLSQFLVAVPLRKGGYMTFPEFLESRYNSKNVRVVAAAFTAILFWFYTVPQIQAVGMLGKFLLNLDYTSSLIICGIAIILYTTYGGMWAVTWTDFLQGVLLVFAILILGLLGVGYLGGIGSAYTQAVTLNPGLFVVNSKIPAMTYIGLFLSVHAFIMSSPHLIMRFFTAKNPSIARKTMMLAVIIQPVVYTISYILIILAGVVILPKLANPDMLTIELSHVVAPRLVSGIFYAGIFAALMSTVSSMLLAVSACVSRDIISVLNPSIQGEKQVTYGKYFTWIIGGLAIAAALKPFALIGMIVAILTGAVGSAFYFPLLLGLYWKRANAAGAMLSMIGGLSVYSVLYFSKKLPMFGEILISLPVALLLIIAGSYLTQTKITDVDHEQLMKKLHS